MACRSHQEELMDLALGALEPARERALRAHVEKCDPCRAWLAACRQLSEAIDAGISAGVKAEPSLEFAARIRRRIAAEPAPRQAWWMLFWPEGILTRRAVTVAACALGIFLLSISLMRRPPAAPHSSAAGEVARSSSPPADVSPGLQERTQTLHRSGQAQGSERRATRTGIPPVRAHRVAQFAPEVIVPPGQREAIFQLVGLLRAGRVDGASLIAPASLLDLSELKIQPLDVPPLSPAGKALEAKPGNTTVNEPNQSPRSP